MKLALVISLVLLAWFSEVPLWAAIAATSLCAIHVIIHIIDMIKLIKKRMNEMKSPDLEVYIITIEDVNNNYSAIEGVYGDEVAADIAFYDACEQEVENENVGTVISLRYWKDQKSELIASYTVQE